MRILKNERRNLEGVPFLFNPLPKFKNSLFCTFVLPMETWGNSQGWKQTVSQNRATHWIVQP